MKQLALVFALLLPTQQFDRSAPWSGIVWKAGSPRIRHDGKWYELLAINGHKTAKILASAEKNFRGIAKKRFDEDITLVMRKFGAPLGATVDLEVRTVPGNKRVTLKRVSVTRNKRAQMMALKRGGRAARAASPAVAGRALTTAQWQADLGEFRECLDQRFAYRKLREIDVEKLFASARSSLAAIDVTTNDLTFQIRTILCAFGDGHSRVDYRPRRWARDDYLPFLIGKAQRGYVAFLPDRSDSVDPSRPYLVDYEGLTIREWLKRSAQIVTRGSPQMVVRMAMRELRNHNQMRWLSGMPPDDDVKVTLTGGKHNRARVKLDLVARKPIYGAWPRTRHRLLGKDLGYLRIDSMTSNNDVLDGLDRAMHEFARTRGLVIDVRGNGGGTRAVLRRLFPYFLSEKNPVHVANVAAYRVPPGSQPAPSSGYLSNRSLYPADWSGWSPAAKTPIAKLASRFEPEWKLPAGDFSEWHYFVLERTDNPKAYRYNKPVVVLLDDGCFSATDVFLGAFKGWPNVTLLGTASMGGSGRARAYRLRNSRIEVRLSSMASFQPNGKLYEGNGIAPDVVVEKTATDFIGKTDSQLAAAIARLRR